MKHLSANELRRLLNDGNAPLVLDVRLAEDHAAGHVSGARHNCVFEVGFASRHAELAPERSQPVVIYGADARSHEAVMAAEKLERAGYTKVAVLTGGIGAWREAGGSIKSTGALPPDPEIADGRHPIDMRESRVRWKGRNLLNQHHGSLAIKHGAVETIGGLPVGGHLVFDMHSIRCADLAGDDLHDVLVNHLKDHDFFDVDRHPEAELKLLGAEPLAGAARGTPNVQIQAALNLKGASAPLGFSAVCGVTENGRFAAQATLALDRTIWNVIYGSGKFFHRLGGHLVNDQIEIEVRLLTRA